MHIPTIAARLASATLLGALAFGAMGAGTAAAASRSSDASINIGTNPMPAAQIHPGSSFTDTFMVRNQGDGSARDTRLMLSFDPAVVRLQSVQFNRAGAWVTATMPNGFQADLGDLSRNGDAVNVTASFVALAGYPIGAPLQAQIDTSWRDNSAKHNHNDLVSVPLLSTAAGQSSPAVGVSTAGVVNVAAAGFTPGEAITFWYNLPTGTAAPLYIRNGQLTTDKVYREQDANAHGKRNVANATVLYADASGHISIGFAIAGLPAGTYSIVAHGMTNGVNAVAPFNA